MKFKTFLFLVIFLVGCSPLNKTNPTSEPIIQQPVATLPAVTGVPATAVPTLAPTVTVPAPEPEVIAIDNINRLQGMQFLAPQQVWKILWPAPDQLLILTQPETPDSAGRVQFRLHPDLMNMPEAPASFNVPARLLDIAPDASQMAYLDDAGVLTLARLDGEVLYTLPEAAPVYGAAYAPDSSRLVTTSQDTWRATLWNTQGEEQGVFTGFETAAPVYAAYAGYGNTLVWLARATAQVDDTQSGQNRFTLSYMDFITGWSFSADGLSLGLAVEGKVRMVDLVSGDERWAQDAAGVYTLAYSPTSQLLAGAGSQGVMLWDAQNGDLLTTLAVDAVNVSFSPDGTALVAALNGGGAEVWQVGPAAKPVR